MHLYLDVLWLLMFLIFSQYHSSICCCWHQFEQPASVHLHLIKYLVHDVTLLPSLYLFDLVNIWLKVHCKARFPILFFLFFFQLLVCVQLQEFTASGEEHMFC